jgi:mycothiol synthase
MPLTRRVYSQATDLHEMYALARQFPADQLHSIDLPYRFSSWAMDEPENTGLWFEGQRLMGWAVLQAPFWTIDITCRPDAVAHLYPEMLAWAEQRARAAIQGKYGRPMWFVMVFRGQTERIRKLEEAGFACQADVGEDSWSKVLLRRPAGVPVKRYLPPTGFTIRPLAGEAEVENYVALHQSVFESKSMTADWRARTLRHPAYRPDLDLVVEAPDGRLAAFCICWLDEKTMDAQVEPLGSHKDFRQFGLGRVVFAEGLHRLQSLGVRNIFVETDLDRGPALRLYRSYDFQTAQDVLVYRRDMNPAA